MSKNQNDWKISKTYFAGSIKQLTLSKEANLSHQRDNLKVIQFQDSEECLVPVGLSNGWKRNRKYWQLVEDLGIDQLETQIMMKELSKCI